MANNKQFDEYFTRRLNEIIESNLSNERFGVTELARKMNMSRSNLHRKVRSAYGTSVSRYINQIRLNRAMELFKESDAGVSEVAYKVGFGSPSYFSRCFQEQYGFPPSEALNYSGAGFSSAPDQAGYHDNPKKKRQASLAWIITGLAVILIVVVFITVVKPFSRPGSSKDIAIIVLPFRNDSPGEADNYIINGLMDEIMNKLTLIDELDVVSRTTSEKYRNSQKSSKEIAREVRVNYILEGSAQTVNNTTRIRLQLIEPSRDRHLWAKPYEQEIKLDNLFDVQEEVSLDVAKELKIVLNLHEKELIQKKPTKDLDAYNAYLQANDLILNMLYEIKEEKSQMLQYAKRQLEHAIELDPKFVEAYTLLSGIFTNDLFYKELNRDVEKAYAYLDSGRILAEKALQYDPRNSLALRLKGTYYQRTGNHKEAGKYIEASFRKKIRSYVDYEWEALSYLEFDNNYAGIKSYLKYLELKPVEMDVPPNLIHSLFVGFMETGFFDLARQQAEQHLTLTRDYDRYYWRMSMLERWQGNHRSAQEYTFKRWELDTTSRASIWWIIANYIYLDEFDSAFNFMQVLEDNYRQQGQDLPRNFVCGWIYLERGQKREAEYHLRGFISRQKKYLQLKTPESQIGGTHLYLGIAYSILGDEQNSLKHIKYLKKCSVHNIGLIWDLKYLSSFDFIRNTPEFQDVLKHMEKLYRKNHKRIARLLRQEGYPASYILG